MLALKEQVDIDHIFGIEHQLLIDGIDDIWRQHSVADMYGIVAACVGVQLTPARECMLANISMFAYLKTGHLRSKLAIALASLVVLCELEGCSDALSGKLRLAGEDMSKLVNCCREDIVHVRGFFLDNLSAITDDVKLIKRVNKLRGTCLTI